MILILFFSCANDPKKTIVKTQNNNCMQKINSDERTFVQKALDVSEENFGTGASYLLTGAGYTSDVIISVVGGVGASIIICSPIITLEAIAKSNGEASGRCIGHMSGEIIKAFPNSIGKTTYESTASWRCPEVDYISKSLRKVASCYQSQQQKDKAYSQLQAILEDPLLQRCSSKKERQKVQLSKNSFSSNL